MGATVTRFYELIKLFKECFIVLFINYSVDLDYLKIKWNECLQKKNNVHINSFLVSLILEHI